MNLEHFLLVGLGNPGKKYTNTRHNIGFIVLDELLKDYNLSWKEEKKYFYQKIKIENLTLHFLKPMEYMNLSGNAVLEILQLYKIAVKNILVVHDEIDFPFGKMKLKLGGGHAGHNGLKDIIQKISSNDFYRLRFGIGRPENKDIEIADYVLSNFNEQEKQELPKLIQKAKEKLLEWIKNLNSTSKSQELPQI